MSRPFKPMYRLYRLYRSKDWADSRKCCRCIDDSNARNVFDDDGCDRRHKGESVDDHKGEAWL